MLSTLGVVLVLKFKICSFNIAKQQKLRIKYDGSWCNLKEIW